MSIGISDAAAAAVINDFLREYAQIKAEGEYTEEELLKCELLREALEIAVERLQQSNIEKRREKQRQTN